MKAPKEFPLPWKPYDAQGIHDSPGYIVAYCDAMRNSELRDYAVHAANNYPRAVKLLGESLYILQHVDIVGEKLKEDIVAFLKDVGDLPEDANPKFFRAFAEESDRYSRADIEAIIDTVVKKTVSEFWNQPIQPNVGASRLMFDGQPITMTLSTQEVNKETDKDA